MESRSKWLEPLPEHRHSKSHAAVPGGSKNLPFRPSRKRIRHRPDSTGEKYHQLPRKIQAIANQRGPILEGLASATRPFLMKSGKRLKGWRFPGGRSFVESGSRERSSPVFQRQRTRADSVRSRSLPGYGPDRPKGLGYPNGCLSPSRMPTTFRSRPVGMRGRGWISSEPELL